MLKANQWRKTYGLFVNVNYPAWTIRDDRSRRNVYARYMLMEEGRPNNSFRYLVDAKRHAEAIISQSLPMRSAS